MSGSYAPLPDPDPDPHPYIQMTNLHPPNLAPPQPGRQPMSPARRRKLIFSYAPDWILTITLAALFFSLDKVDGYRRVFSLEDTSLRHPFAKKERVPNIALFLICFVIPLVMQPLINVLTVRSWWDFHNGSLGLILGLATTGSITQFSKITVGRPRPDIIDRCQPIPGSVDPTYQLTTSAVCTQVDKAILRDGFRSFPSGHSSLSFAGLGFLSFYLAGKLHLFDRRGHTGKAWIALAPFAGASLVAISRTMDYRHHWHDVLIGSLLGTTMAFFSYRQYYPSLGSEFSHRPYSPRIKREGHEILPVLPIHHHHSDSGQQILPSGQAVSAAGHHVHADQTEDELHGTVPRPEPGALDLWGDNEHSDRQELSKEVSQA